MSEQHGTVRLQSSLARVRGMGSAKGGTHHWWMQRVTSIALLPLTIWFVFAVAGHTGSTHAELVTWMARPLNAVLLLSFVLISFHHAAAGMQVIIEDYVRGEMRMFLILAVKAGCWILALAAALAVLRIAI
ncbi:succinate dehydrogenase, hydrophobic membrane anchor protein [Pseudoroseomonas ludipueritiae]|uniref:Succinate dehydrogenase hydrophobic membrane anchor subunit n=1 Tax=Pseudoroseomonas ludipueritiae TaxID=198093 RepID=A0ABR7RD95_9PROT|nr:succinate dehydrogenase, hydrophobic membrane anchor protein [Pseudoroseomonas ludipueritiae]MBC9179743.1 succinate dehydrogenase, hydrophobic membrane anchor protein [Pseudoroseomonas ludipueritiae]MCG7359973.1 succinate dehydrogenase, hydrophobic membrane anchor protein [Roseomonas sp. ACRSG]